MSIGSLKGKPIHVVTCKGCDEVFAIACAKSLSKKHLEAYHKGSTISYNPDYRGGLIGVCTCEPTTTKEKESK